MKKLFIILLILISISSFSQTTKGDSLLVIEAQKYVDTLTRKANINELKEWAYKTVSAEAYDSFMGVYNLFLQRKGEEYFNKKKAKNK